MKLTNGGMSRIYKLYTFLAYLCPMLALFIIKRDEFSSQGGVIGFWGIIALFLCIIAFREFCVSFFKKYRQLSISLIVLIIGLLSEFLGDNMVIIGAVSTAASLISMFFSCVADVYENHAFRLVDGEKTLNRGAGLKQSDAWREAYFFGFAEE